jgi:hypothetical protein
MAKADDVAVSSASSLCCNFAFGGGYYSKVAFLKAFKITANKISPA